MAEIKLCDKELCTGCMACYNACPHQSLSMKADDEGFLYPVIDQDTCLKCGKCIRACPILDAGKPDVKQTAFKGWTKDDELLRNSSSGGVFSMLSSQILKRNGVVFGAAFDDDMTVKHASVTSESEMSKLRGSKYVQSYIDEQYREVKRNLEADKYVLFCGTPCQVAGLKKFLGAKDYPKLLTIDLVCHGVPSPKVFKAYIGYQEAQNDSRVVSYNFREKKWSWARYNSIVTFNNGTEYRGKWEEDPWMRGFLREYFLRPSCHHCHFTNMQRPGDITLADFWSYWEKKGEIDNKDTGCSLILLNNDKGREFFEPCKEGMNLYPITLDEAKGCNQSLSRCFPPSPKRDVFWADFNGGMDYGKLIEKYMYPEAIDTHFGLVYKYGREGLPTQLYDMKTKMIVGVKVSLLKVLRKLKLHD